MGKKIPGKKKRSVSKSSKSGKASKKKARTSPKKSKKKKPKVKDPKVEEEEGEPHEKVDEKLEKEAEDFRRRITSKTLTPSTVQRKAPVVVKKTWKPKVAGILLIIVSVIGLITSSNLIMTANMSPLYSPDKGSLKGFILSEDGERLSGAIVKVEGTALVDYADENGKFKFTDIPRGERVIVTSFPGYISLKFKTLVIGGTQTEGIGNTNLTLISAKAAVQDETTGNGPLKGIVYDNNRNPESGVAVRDTIKGTNSTTDANGGFDLGMLPVGKRELVFTKANFNTRTLTLFVTPDRPDLEVLLNPGSGAEMVDLTVGKARVTGTVLDALGAPIPDSLVEINGTAFPIEDDGSFSIEADAGEITVTASGIGQSSSSKKMFLDLDGGKADLVLEKKAASISEGDREALKSNLSICGIVTTAMSIFILSTGLVAVRRRSFWMVVTGSLFGSVFMLMTFQYGIILGLSAFFLVLFSRREFE